MLNIFRQDPSLVYEIQQGIERECLRIKSDGHISLDAHPKSLGSKLTHAFITTDFSENLLEFITKVHKSPQSVLEELETIHGYTQSKIGDELLWGNSMPPILPEEDSEIPLAYYGDSNVGKLKTLYRNGLGLRYGRSMQSIAGLHYNFSLSDNFWDLFYKEQKFDGTLSDFKSKKYFHLIRNFKRHRWLLVYLFGASPVVDKSFLKGKKHNLGSLNSDTFYTSSGTSLRMGGLGYTSSAQSNLGVCFNKLDTYINSIEKARLTPYPAYEKLSDKGQLNSNILQIDNEFYATIRPKNIAKSRESALKALHSRGIEYIEVRLIDIDPFSPLGISNETIHFLHLFLLWCLSNDSPGITSTECRELDEVFNQVVRNGRNKDVVLKIDNEDTPIGDLLKNTLEKITDFSQELSRVEPLYTKALDQQWDKVKNSDLLPSNKLLNDLGSQSFVKHGIKMANSFGPNYSLSAEKNIEFDLFSKESLEAQRVVESNDNHGFDDFLKKYFEDIKI